ncbi:hypothetical protein [Methanohalophilus halophilus]|uniref:Uncharacterized protein n=1 Tax=Methanohalophilus halophilus TaxID=2177 RepID=A0A1H2PYQ1_9EURY|nr:hypothetical protein [Methanohalophilus halophilus]SDV99634.1 hypothetical protein SAMN04515625_0039 [Methanohalophilus halophilus]
MTNITSDDINAFEFAQNHRDILWNLAKHGTLIEKAMAKAYLELYGGQK